MKKIAAVLIMAILIGTFPNCHVTASQSPRDMRRSYHSPQEFIQWLYDYVSDNDRKRWENFVDVYRKKSNAIIAPRLENIPLNCVCWGVEDTALNYRFYNGDFFCIIYVYPVAACQAEPYYSDDIGILVKNREMKYKHLEYNQTERYTLSDEKTGEFYEQTQCYTKKKLRLKDEVVDCVQCTCHRKGKTINQYADDLHFFMKDAYVRVVTPNYQNDGEKKLLQAMKTCSFQTLYTIPKVKLNKKKNKITKKNAILHATMYNYTRGKALRVNLYFYDNRTKKYKLYYTKKVTEKNRTNKTLAI